MPDITFDDLIAAKKNLSPNKTESVGGFEGFFSGMTQEGLMNIGGMALNILKEFKSIQGSTVLATRPVQDQTTVQEVNKPMVDTEQIKEALTTIKALKGDIKVTQMLELLEENKEAVAGFLKTQ